MARGHGIRGASKTGKRATKPASPSKPARFEPADEPLDLTAGRVGGLVVKREAPGGPELRLLVDVDPDVVEVLEWLGVATMVVDLGGI